MYIYIYIYIHIYIYIYIHICNIMSYRIHSGVLKKDRKVKFQEVSGSYMYIL